MTSGDAPWPTEIRLRRASGILEVDFDDGRRVSLSAAQLRLATPSAADHGHGPRPVGFSVRIDESLRVLDARPIGRYALRLVFSDGHDTGLYTWPLLYRLGADAALTA